VPDRGPARDRALAQLDMAERVLPGLLATLESNAAYCALLRDAAGTDPAQWDAADSGAREYVLSQGRRALLRAAKVSRRQWDAMAPRTAERSAALLSGAARLGIETDWPGWPERETS
jgi:hypothetical protein